MQNLLNQLLQSKDSNVIIKMKNSKDKERLYDNGSSNYIYTTSIHNNIDYNGYCPD